MIGQQRLHPEAIFALNRVLGWQLWSYLYPEGVPPALPLVVPSRFSKSSRSFRWLAVDDEPSFDPNNIKTAARELAESWNAFSDELATRGSRRARASLERVQQFIGAGSAPQPASELHRHLLILYESYRLPADLYLDGILYRNLAELHKARGHSNRITHVTGQLLRDRKDTFDSYPWVDATFWSDQEDLKLPRYHCQEAPLSGSSNEAEIHKPELQARPANDFAATLLKCVFLRGSQAGHSNFLLVPLYDNMLGTEPAGSIWGNLLLLFQQPAGPGEFVRSGLLNELRKYALRLVHQFTGAAWSAILAEPPAPGANLVEHFLKHMTRLQDWESVTVYRHSRSGRKYEPRYCYRRPDWKPCEGFSSRRPCSRCLSWRSAMEQAKAGTHVVWGEDVWNADLLTEVRAIDGLGLEGTAFAFEYPVSAVIPSDAGRREMLREAYILQQLELLRDLAPRVAERRSATRSAATAIMSRNLSHNIGSHVLSSLSVEESLRRATRPQHARFYAYLRSRMDFLATVMTARARTAVPLMLYRDVIAAFRPNPRDKAMETYGQKLLLDRISAIQSLDAEHVRLDVRKDGLPVTLSEADRDRDALFASPEGVMGAQALYAILENIIRNSAKFARPAPSQITLIIALREFITDEGWPMFEVTLSDSLGTASPSLVTQLKTAMDAPIIDGAGAPRSGSWGLAEIKCCAAFLRQVPIEEVDRSHNPPLVEPLLADEDGLEATTDTGSLAYRFYLNRPREVVIVCPPMRWPAEARRAQLARLGVDFVDPAAVFDAGFMHRLMLWYGEAAIPDVYGQVRSSLPLRLLVPSAWAAADAAVAEEHLLRMVEALLLHDVTAAVAALDTAWLRHVTAWTSSEIRPELCRTDGGADRPLIPAPPGVGRMLNRADRLHPNMIVYDRHGCLYSQIVGLAHNARPRFWEPYQQGEPVYPYVEHGVALPSDAYERLQRDLTEAAIVRVLVADERVQKAIYGKQPATWRHGANEIPMRDILPMMAIEVPDLTCDLDAPDRGILEAWLTQHAGAGVLVIHQNLLDKLDRPNDEAADWLAAVVNRTGIRHTVVDSGRGVPFKKLNWARFVRLSDLLDWTVGSKSKYHLVQTLFSSRST